jgi:hypothetical protein
VYRIPSLLGQVVKKVQQNLRIYWTLLSFQTPTNPHISPERRFEFSGAKIAKTDSGDGRNGHFFSTRAHAPLPPLFVGVPGTALSLPHPLPSALTTCAKIA